MSDQHKDTSASQNEKTVYENLCFGLSVWKKNMKSMFSDLVHKFEVKQLEKRLEQEYGALGKAASTHLETNEENPVAPSFEMVSSFKQVTFLKEEITRLKNEHKRDA